MDTATEHKLSRDAASIHVVITTHVVADRASPVTPAVNNPFQGLLASVSLHGGRDFAPAGDPFSPSPGFGVGRATYPTHFVDERTVTVTVIHDVLTATITMVTKVDLSSDEGTSSHR